MPDGTLNDTEIVEEIEKIVDYFTRVFYDTTSDEAKRTVASFALGQISGTLMRRKI